MEDSTKNHRTVFCFFSLGLWTSVIPVVIVWIAIEDLLSGTLLSSTVVIISYSLSDILSKMFGPYVVKRISFQWSIALMTLLFVVSVLIIVVAEDVRLRIVGVFVNGIANGFAVITCVRMLAYYEQSHVLASAYQNGDNAAMFLASLGYTGLTTWLCVPPRIVIAICIAVSFLPLIFYALLDKKPLEMHVQETTKNKEDHQEDKCPESTLSKRVHTFTMIFKAFPFVSYCYIANFCMHFSMTAVLSTLSFPSSPFPPRDHFQYYRMLSNIGILAGGMGHLVISSLFKEFTDLVRVRKIWILSFLDVSHLLFFVFASWYRFLPSVVPVLVMCVTQGFIHGLTLVQAHANVANVFSSSESDRGTALGWIQVGLSVGRIAAGVLGVHTEMYLREHCTYRLLLGKYCLARHSSYAGWETNLSCSI